VLAKGIGLPKRRVAAAGVLEASYDDADLSDRPADERLRRSREFELRHAIDFMV
jgi:hypothetical protein